MGEGAGVGVGVGVGLGVGVGVGVATANACSAAAALSSPPVATLPVRPVTGVVLDRIAVRIWVAVACG